MHRIFPSIRTAFVLVPAVALAVTGLIGCANMDHTASALAQSQLGDLAEAAVGAQFSQHEELDAGSYSLDFFRKHGVPPESAVTALRKLGGGSSTFLSSHPDSESRARQVEEASSRSRAARRPRSGAGS